MEPTDLARRIAAIAQERKAANPIILDVRPRSSYADFLVIASGTSDRHVRSIAELIEEKLREESIRPIGMEGLREGQWALLDYGDVVVHIFHQFTREVYDLESLWSEAPRVSVDLAAS